MRHLFKCYNIFCPSDSLLQVAAEAHQVSGKDKVSRRLLEELPEFPMGEFWLSAFTRWVLFLYLVEHLEQP